MRTRTARLTGLDLKLARIASGLRQRELADRLRVSAQRISAIEATWRPTLLTCRRYLGALAALADPGIDAQAEPVIDDVQEVRPPGEVL